MERDNIVQYLAMYTASKGLMAQTTPDEMQHYFVLYKQGLRKGEFSLEWLVNHVIMKWGIPPDQDQENKKLVKEVEGAIDHIALSLAEAYMKQEEQGKGGIATAQIDPNHPYKDVLGKLKVIVEKYKKAETDKKPRKKKQEKKDEST